MATVIYGARGSGKTSLGAVMAEEVAAAKQRFCAIDLKGDWWGLKGSSDGREEGIPAVVFGGDHADVPLEDGAGAFMGETVATLEQSCILDFENFSKGKQLRFLAAFFETLYHKNREPLILFLDEAQRYAPQRPMSPEATICLGAVEDIVKLGRKHGIGPALITQRGSGLNKEVSELCDMLVAFRTPGPLDQDRVKDWLDANTTRAQRDEVMGRLSGLPTGTAIFASGHPDLKLFGQYAVRRRWTFDSCATPKVGKIRSEPSKLAKPDLEVLRTKMAAAIERAKADDPKHLRQRIAGLEQDVDDLSMQLVAEKKRTAAKPSGMPKLVEVATLPATEVSRLNEGIRRLGRLNGSLQASLTASIHACENLERNFKALEEKQAADLAKIREILATEVVVFDRSETVHRFKMGGEQSTTASVLSDEEIIRTRPSAPGKQSLRDRILHALAWWRAAQITAPSRTQVAFVAGCAVNGHFNNTLGSLRTEGLIDYPVPGSVRGVGPLPDIQAPVSRAQLIGMVRGVLRGGLPGRIFEALVKVNGEISREDLAQASGCSVNGHFNNTLGSLRTRGVVTYPEPGRVVLSPMFYAFERERPHGQG